VADERTIVYISGMEPMREGEYPTSYQVGTLGPHQQRITRIDYKMEDFGDHEMGWFFIYGESGVIAKMQARAVAEVVYSPEVVNAG